jgi:O-antigen/teichoic acid export membrane protein
VFSKQQDKNNKQAYAEAMKYYIIVSVFVFLGILFYLDILKYLLDASYHKGVVVVPVVLLTYVFQGITFNLSFWYKLTDKTSWGAYISYLGLVITILGNVLFVPVFGYIASAWASCICYLVMMLVSWFLGKKHYPIPYDLKQAARYLLIGAAGYLLGVYVPIENLALRLFYRTILLLVLVGYVLRNDFPKGTLKSIFARHKQH